MLFFSLQYQFYQLSMNSFLFDTFSVETGMKSGQSCQLCLKNAKCLQLKSCRLFFEKSHVCSLISEKESDSIFLLEN